MKVLLFADLSGFHQTLRDGLAEHGADVTLASSGDGFKAIAGADFRLGSDPDWGRGRRLLHQARIVRLFAGHDVVQFVNPMQLAGNPAVNSILLRYIKAVNSRLFAAVCSLDHRVYDAYQSGVLRYGPYGQAAFDIEPYKVKKEDFDKTRKTYDQFISAMDGLIPISVDYSIPYFGHPKLSGLVHAPVNIKKLEYRENFANTKIVFMHGIQLGREGFKGTKVIKQALEWLKGKYPNDVDINYPTNMPFSLYREQIYKSNVIIDQCNSLAPGLNALQAMAMGRVVLSGSSKEHIESLGVAYSPLVPVTNDLDNIKTQLVAVLEGKSDLTARGAASRSYIERHHDHVAVAGRYIELWSGRR